MNTLRFLRGPSLAAGLMMASSLPAAAPAPAAAPEAPAPAGRSKAEPGPGRRPGPRTEPAPARGDVRRVTFLGVQVTDVPPVLGAQLGLAPETGLAVVHVAGRGPASEVLKPHDVLTRLDDQQLIDARQLSVLVRNHREGDEVNLTFVRAGQRMQAKVRLGTQELPPPGGFGPGRPGAGFRMGSGPGSAPVGDQDERDRARNPEDRGRLEDRMGPGRMRGPDGPPSPPIPAKAI